MSNQVERQAGQELSLCLVNKTIPARTSLLPTACQSSVTTSQLFNQGFSGYKGVFPVKNTPSPTKKAGTVIGGDNTQLTASPHCHT